jgi:hypothetical protein
VVAQRLVVLAKDSSSLGSTSGLEHAGSIRLRDSIVMGYCLQRATRRKPHTSVRPSFCVLCPVSVSALRHQSAEGGMERRNVRQAV